MKVKRYNLTNPYDCDMEKHPTGNYVLFEAYKEMCDYADRLVEHKDMVCLPADLENLRKANAHFATENELLKNTMANDRDAAAAEAEEFAEFRTYKENQVAQYAGTNVGLNIDLHLAKQDIVELTDQRDRLAKHSKSLLHYVKLARKGDSPLIQASIVESIDLAAAKLEESLNQPTEL